jgi:hypothetical protein
MTFFRHFDVPRGTPYAHGCTLRQSDTTTAASAGFDTRRALGIPRVLDRENRESFVLNASGTPEGPSALGFESQVAGEALKAGAIP